MRNLQRLKAAEYSRARYKAVAFGSSGFALGKGSINRDGMTAYSAMSIYTYTLNINLRAKSYLQGLSFLVRLTTEVSISLCREQQSRSLSDCKSSTRIDLSTSYLLLM